MGVFLALAVTFESKELGLWVPSVSHPSVYERLGGLIRVVEPVLSDWHDDFWVFACSIVLSKARRGNRIPETIPFRDCRDLFDKALELIRVN